MFAHTFIYKDSGFRVLRNTFANVRRQDRSKKKTVNMAYS